MFDVVIPKEDLAWLLGAALTPTQFTAAHSEAKRAKRPFKVKDACRGVWSAFIEERPCLVSTNGSSLHVLDLSSLPRDQRAGFAPGMWAPVDGIARPARNHLNALVHLDHAPEGLERIDFAKFLGSLHVHTRPGSVFQVDREFLLSLAEAGCGAVAHNPALLWAEGRQVLLRTYSNCLSPGLRVRGRDLWGKDQISPSALSPYSEDHDTYLRPDLLRAALDDVLLGDSVEVRLREDALAPVVVAQIGEETVPERFAVIMPVRVGT